MKRRRTGPIIFTLLVLVALGVAGWYILGREVTFVLTRDYLQSQLVSGFPYEKRELLYSLSARDPKLRLAENTDQIGLTLDLDVSVLGGRKVSGTLTAEAGLRYDPAQTAFFLDKPRVTDVRIPGLPESITSRVPGVATVAVQAALNKQPIYRLTDTDARVFVLRRTLKSVKVRNGSVEAVLGVR